ncbi:GPI ethanolamine phosphate transferase 2 [Aspergillus japonicus CBS 114.51]|uniref:GPI ethanolamine phosphate transferase 2 n=2 Tax=Aspergillus TaxID=5052 RepID=A0A2V5HHP1_ASPV1|nr:GPI ethanolamine phosphate transferase 2 [Aspergillus japonicus CBS 114.51]PYI23311.1 GPI ethanolamine phosphate transferase 2 [Aspergillus violaceofuscus CBS 115571]RAH83432.1 GPI ethanolamine phosphate transferase 2 [Aspergillus japonicus CBS 114.51]
MAAVSGVSAILIANVLIPLAIAIFSSGFFPYKPLVSGLAECEDSEQNVKPPFDKVIFMVVDALRSDFVYSNASGFAFTQSLIRSGAALPFTAHASSPTVTMPRLKAMTTGSTPSFLDVIFNIAESDTSTTLAFQDTWLAQLRARGDRLVMYGDDTWLKLFPGMFDRADGTTSFYVSDFTEVDHNVTRHVPNELLQDDWSAFIMHFLGLDHIGHKLGPRSSHMFKKQREMDSVIGELYASIERGGHLQSTLLVLCGDHGMNDAGNHGGSSSGETSPALLFISPLFKTMGGARHQAPIDIPDDFQCYKTVDQTDIVPTLAGLLGFPIPLNNLGVFIPDLLDVWHLYSQRTKVLLANAKQLLRRLEHSFPDHKIAADQLPGRCTTEPLTSMHEAQCAWLQVMTLIKNPISSEDQDELEPALSRFLSSAQEVLTNAASDYNLRQLLLGIGAMALAVLLLLPNAYKQLSISMHSGAFLAGLIVCYGGMMFASSYVEEEHQFWNWTFSAWTFLLHVKAASRRSCASSEQLPISNGPFSSSILAHYATLALFATHRILRRWNQTGQKFAAEPDIAHNFFPTNLYILWPLVIVTYADICVHLSHSYHSSKLWRLICIAVTATAFLFKLGSVVSDFPELLGTTHIGTLKRAFNRVPLILLSRIVFVGLLLLILVTIYNRKKTWKKEPFMSGMHTSVMHEALTLLLITQSRTTNIPLFLIFRLQAVTFASMNLSGIELTITSLLMQYMTFFASGGSNAISSVDLSNAYNGIDHYSVFFVGLLTFVGNWAGPIWWASAARHLRYRQTWKEKEAHMTTLTFHIATSSLCVMVACMTLRAHLFIWTVFSPKYLYMMAWAVMGHLGVNLLGEFS